MKKKSTRSSRRTKWVYFSAADLPKRTAKDNARLQAACDGPIDTSDIPELDEDFWRNATRPKDRLPRRVIPMELDKDVAKAVKKAGPNRVNFILRRYLIIENLRQARKAG